MPFDSSLNSEYLASRFGEDPLPEMKRSGKLRGNPDGFLEEQVQPPLNLKLPFPIDKFQSFIMRMLATPGLQIVRDETLGGGGGGGGGGSGTGVNTSGFAGQGPLFWQYMLNANQNTFGDYPTGHAYVASPTNSLPPTITLWPPHPSSVFITDPSGPMSGPPGSMTTTTAFSGGTTVSVIDGVYGDITVSGTSWTVNSGAISSTELGGDITAIGKTVLTSANDVDVCTSIGAMTHAKCLMRTLGS